MESKGITCYGGPGNQCGILHRRTSDVLRCLMNHFFDARQGNYVANRDPVLVGVDGMLYRLARPFEAITAPTPSGPRHQCFVCHRTDET